MLALRVALVPVACTAALCAQAVPASVFSDHMVLQRDQPIAVWGTAAMVVGTCEVMGIKSMEDLRRVMHAQLTPLGEGIKETVTPIKGWFASAVGTERAPMRTVDTQFSKGIKEIFA